MGAAAADFYGKVIPTGRVDALFAKAWPELDRKLRRIASGPADGQHGGKLAALAAEVSKELARAGLDAPTLASGTSLSEAPLEVQLNVRRLLGELSGGLEQLSPAERVAVHGGEDQKALFETGRAMIAEHRWVEAARYLDEDVGLIARDWRGQKWRGIAHAMSRQGHAADAAALDAYKHALDALPRKVTRNTRALLFNYRGAMYKRLGRYNDAIRDLHKAEQMAEDDLLLKDIHYNLACVFALTGKRQLVMDHVRAIGHAKRETELIKRHLTDYFKSFSSDRGLLELLARSPRRKPTRKIRRSR